jgi:hypothetical protein
MYRARIAVMADRLLPMKDLDIAVPSNANGNGKLQGADDALIGAGQHCGNS